MPIQSKRITLVASVSPAHLLCASGAYLLCSCLTLACTSEGVDLGGGTLTQDLTRAGRCAESTRIDENVIVDNQDELAALAGCEEIRGDLIVHVFAGADLTPLHSLRSVEGAFSLGASPSQDDIVGYLVNESLDPDLALIKAGWLESLSGVESLERAGALALRGLPDADLTAFEHLENVGGSLGGLTPSVLILQQNQNLRDLKGLEKLRGVTSFVATLNPALESLNGLVPAEELQGVALYASPALTDIGALAELRTLDDLIVYQTGLNNLSAVGGLETVRGALSVFENPALADASGLAALQTAEIVSFKGNPSLTRLPPFVGFTSLPRFIEIHDNAALQTLALDFSSAAPNEYYLEGYANAPAGVDARSVDLGIDVIDIRNNGSLQNISIPAGLTSARLFLIQENASLSAVDFGSLQDLGQLSIDDNANLALVGLGGLETVSSLRVTNNPRLSNAAFAVVQSFERELSGNAE